MSEMTFMPAPIDWVAILPVIVVFGTGVVAMTIEMIRPRRNNNAIVWTSLAGLAAGAYCVLLNWGRPSEESFGKLFINDRFGLVIQLVLIAATFITLLYSEGYLREKRLPFGEYYPLILWSATGGMMMSTSRDLLVIFLGLEVLSISLYILAGLSSREKRSQESALKYFLLGAFASGFLLFGIALIYGATGTSHLTGIGALFESPSAEAFHLKILYGGLALVLVGFGFKAALVPFHMWTPDVYQGAPTSVTGFMAAGSKVAAFAALIRFLDAAIDSSAVWLPLLTVIAVATMTLGNLVALVQRDAKRILGYSSIAQAGYVLVAVAAYAALKGTGKEIGYSTAVYYLIAYSVMTIGAFAVLSLTAKGGKEGTALEDFYGLWQRAPFPAATMILFMASLAGVPITVGFVGKFLIFKDALDAGMLWLALVLAANSVISAFYYLRIVLAIYVQVPEFHGPRFANVNVGLFATCLVCGFLILALAFGAQPVLDWMGLQPAASEIAVR